jgi:hypothetical protein
MRWPILGAACAAMALCACSRPDEPAGLAGAHGAARYVGLGHYAAGRLWPELKRSGEPAEESAANLRDDDEILVVVDTHTGEVRQCGNLSGYCLAMNPWRGAPQGVQAAPAALLKHWADLEREDRAAQQAQVAVSVSKPQ